MIHVEGDWYIDVDNNCFTLGKRYESTDNRIAVILSELRSRYAR